MKAIVVYESHWGNTAEIARAIAAGIGPGTAVVPTDEAFGPVLDEADLVIAGAPVMAFGLPSEQTLTSLAERTSGGPRPPDVSHPALRSWLADLPSGRGHAVAFETGVRWSPGGARGTIERAFETAGYQRLAKGRRFVVTGQQGPLRDGEIEAARRWGAELAATLSATARQPVLAH